MNVKKLISWSRKEFSHLPWRSKRTIYGTLVSEIMLQQTTVSTVKNHFERFLKRFPDLDNLVNATEEELIIAWKGLGYYRRARNLKKIAEVIVKDHDGVFPKDLYTLQAIPGIGPYTANALLAVGMNQRGLAVDANLERVIARFFGLKDAKGSVLQKKIYQLFESNKIFSDGDFSYRDLNEALMDLGRTYCQARKVSCELCHINKNCKAFLSGHPFNYPLDEAKKNKKEEKEELKLLRLYVQKRNKILVYKKSDREWLHGQYEVPTYILSSTDEKITQYPRLKKEIVLKEAKLYSSAITKYRIKNYAITMSEKEFLGKFSKEHYEWRDITDEMANLSSATMKGLKKIGD